MRWRDYGVEAALCATVFALALACIGWFGLFDVDEAIFGEATREMVETRDFITPTYNYRVRYDKPVFIYWVMAGPVKWFGANSFGARFHSAAAGALLVLLVALFGRAVFGVAAGRWAGVIAATSLHLFLLGRMAFTDITLTLLMAAGWMALYFSTERRSPGWFALAGLALGLATLTKGPVALVLPGLTWLVWLLWRRELWATLRATRCWWGVLLYAAVLAPWCYAIYRAHQWDFYQSFLGYHNLDRLTRTQSGHGGPVFTFLVVVAVGLAPWGGFALSGAIDAVRRRAADAEGRAALYLLLWLAGVIGLFSLSKTKLPNYIAPCYPAAVLLAGWAVARGLETGVTGRWWRIWPSLVGLLGLGGALLSAGVWLPRLAGLQRELGGAVVAPGQGPVLAGLVILIAVAMAAALWCLTPPRPAAVATAVAGLAVGLAVWLGVLPLVDEVQQSPPREMARLAARHTRPLGELVLLNVHVPSVVFYYQQPVVYWRADDPGLKDRIRSRFSSRLLVLVITRDRRLGDLLDGVPHHVWMQRYGWRLVSNLPQPE